jgi:hypothetical protein
MFVAVLCINANIATNVIKTKQGPLFCEKETATTSKQAAAAFHDSKNREAFASRFFFTSTGCPTRRGGGCCAARLNQRTRHQLQAATVQACSLLQCLPPLQEVPHKTFSYIKFLFSIIGY